MRRSTLVEAIAAGEVSTDVTVAVREALRALILERSLMRGRFVLSSGKEADYYLDLRLLTLSADAAPLVAYLVLERMLADVELVGGPVIGADPIVGAVVSLAPFFGRSLDGFLVRKEPKGHGTRNWLEGPVRPGARVCLVEDVVTTGGSLLRAAERVREAGLEPVQAICLVDREEADASTAFSALGIRYEPLYRVSELLGA